MSCDRLEKNNLGSHVIFGNFCETLQTVVLDAYTAILMDASISKCVSIVDLVTFLYTVKYSFFTLPCSSIIFFTSMEMSS